MSVSPRIANPLATISIFLTFCEITAGIAATQTEGWVQAVLAVFSVSFPATIAVGLFVLLWKKPEVLYAPGDYSVETPIRDYVEAVRGATLPAAVTRQAEAMEKIVASAVETTITKFRKDPTANNDIDARTLAREVADYEIRKSAIEVQLPIIASSSRNGHLLLPIEDYETTVDEFLDTLYFAMQKLVPPYTYGQTWVLINEETGQSLTKVGASYVGNAGRRGKDNRLLSEVGIIPGRRFAVRLLAAPTRASWE